MNRELAFPRSPARERPSAAFPSRLPWLAEPTSFLNATAVLRRVVIAFRLIWFGQGGLLWRVPLTQDRQGSGSTGLVKRMGTNQPTERALGRTLGSSGELSASEDIQISQTL